MPKLSLPGLAISKFQRTANKIAKLAPLLMIGKDTTCFLSLLSQERRRINIEIIEDEGRDMLYQDDDEEEFSINGKYSCFEKIRVQQKQRRMELKRIKLQEKMNVKLKQVVTVDFENEILVDSEIGWLAQKELILTINNNFFMVNLSQDDLK
jgi:hypothetical protein